MEKFAISRWFFARGFFYPEDGGDTILRNVGLIDHIYTAPHPRRRHSSGASLFKFWCRQPFLKSVLETTERNLSALMFQIADRWSNGLEPELPQKVIGSSVAVKWSLLEGRRAPYAESREMLSGIRLTE
jgi:hypothetical protein